MDKGLTVRFDLQDAMGLSGRELDELIGRALGYWRQNHEARGAPCWYIWNGCYKIYAGIEFQTRLWGPDMWSDGLPKFSSMWAPAMALRERILGYPKDVQADFVVNLNKLVVARIVTDADPTLLLMTEPVDYARGVLMILYNNQPVGSESTYECE